MSLGERIRRQRKIQKMEQKDLSTLSGIPIRTIQDIESGKTDPRVSNIVKIVITLGCTADEIIFDDDELPENADLEILFRELKKTKGETRKTVKTVIKALLIQERAKELE